MLGALTWCHMSGEGENGTIVKWWGEVTKLDPAVGFQEFSTYRIFRRVYMLLYVN